MFILIFLSPMVSLVGAIDPEPHIPAYAEVFDQITTHADGGREVEALKLFPQLYAEEIPVDAFYTTLENKRIEILKQLYSKEASLADEDVISIEGIRRLCGHMYTRLPMVYRHHLEVVHEMSFDRLLFFLVVYDETTDSLLSSQISKRESKRIKSLFFSSDPWVVSASLFFFGHAQRGILSPEDIVRRWQDRPDLWDEVCTDQALLALASHEPDALSSARKNYPDLGRAFDRLKLVDADSSLVEVVVFGAQDLNVLTWSPKATLITMDKKAGNPGTVKRWAGDANQASTHEDGSRREFPSADIQKVEPGMFRISVRAQMCWGDSIPFKAKAGTFLRLFVEFQCGI